MDIRKLNLSSLHVDGAKTNKDKRKTIKSKMQVNNTGDFSSMVLENKSLEGRLVEEISEEEISNLITELSQKSTHLQNAPSIEAYYEYKKTIEVIFKRTISQSMLLDKVEVPGSGLKVKEYHFVSTINLELASLLKMLHGEQRDNLALVKQVVKINGMLVNHLV